MFDVDKFIENNKKDTQTRDREIISLSLADSRGAEAIIKIVNARLLSTFVKKAFKSDDNNLFRLYFSDVFYKRSDEKRTSRYLNFSNKVIFNFRELIEPVNWFFSSKEKMPKPIKVNYNKNRTEESLFFEKTVGKILFEKLLKEYNNYLEFSKIYEIPVSQIKNMIYTYPVEVNGRKVPRFKTFVTKSVIMKLRKQIHPDFWYIFPEELPEDSPIYNSYFASFQYEEQEVYQEKQEKKLKKASIEDLRNYFIKYPHMTDSFFSLIIDIFDKHNTPLVKDQEGNLYQQDNENLNKMSQSKILNQQYQWIISKN